jgi:hypothetical protein
VRGGPEACCRIMGVKVSELSEVQLCQFFSHFGDGGWEGGAVGDSLRL